MRALCGGYLVGLGGGIEQIETKLFHFETYGTWPLGCLVVVVSTVGLFSGSLPPPTPPFSFVDGCSMVSAVNLLSSLSSRLHSWHIPFN